MPSKRDLLITDFGEIELPAWVGLLAKGMNFSLPDRKTPNGLRLELDDLQELLGWASCNFKHG